MNWKFWILSTVAILLVVEMFSLLPHRFAKISERKDRNYSIGTIHNHSVFSDGGGTVPQIAQAAHNVGFDFVVLTDHNTTEARRAGFEKNYAGTDVFVEMEASTGHGHVLIFSSHTPSVSLTDKKLSEVAWLLVNRELELPGVFTVIAHPTNVKNSWRYLDVFPTDGIEIVNLDSIWQRELFETPIEFSLTAMLSPINNFLAALRFFQVFPPDLQWWDASNRLEHGHFGIMAHDAHSRLKLRPDLIFELPTYEMTFRLGANVVFFDGPAATDFEARKKQIYDSIHAGKSAVIYQLLHPFEGNDWYIEKDGKRFHSGEAIPVGGNCLSVARIPDDLNYPAVYRLLKEGAVVGEMEFSDSHEIRTPFRCDRGTYRAEIATRPRTFFRGMLHREVPYVIYNPVYVDY